MKKLICILLTVCMLFALAACGETKPVEEESKEWTRQGTFEDENGNHLIVNLSETEGYEGWAISLMLDGEAVGWIIQQEGNALRGNLNGWDEEMEPFNVTVTEEGEDGLKLEVEGGETYHFTPVDVPEATIVVTVNIEGWGHIAYTEGEEVPEIDPEFPAQSAYIGLAEPAVHTFLAEPEAGNLFVKWTKNGEDYSTEPQITLLLDESAEYIAVFEEDPNWQNPVMNFVGEYQCDRAHATVECWGFDEAFITIVWGSSAWEQTRWIIVGKLDTDTLAISYSGASKAELVYDEAGEIKSDESPAPAKQSLSMMRLAKSRAMSPFMTTAPEPSPSTTTEPLPGTRISPKPGRIWCSNGSRPWATAPSPCQIPGRRPTARKLRRRAPVLVLSSFRKPEWR